MSGAGIWREGGETPWRLIGTPRAGGILVVSDHAGCAVPDDIDLGIDPALMETHIAVDLGVARVAELLVGDGSGPEANGIAAFVSRYSRLVCDLNRDEHAPSLIPIASDGHAIPGNAIDHAGHEARRARFYRPYHAALAALLEDCPPALILSVHSFTPRLASHPEEARPWQVGVLYNQDDRAARIAIPLLESEGLIVGDQQPYSGVALNYTMNRHAEGRGRVYLGLEIRQDEIADEAGQRLWAGRLARLGVSLLRAGLGAGVGAG